MITIRHNADKCDYCGTCVAVCPADAIELREFYLNILYDRCTACQRCIVICPIHALEAEDEVKV
jgi:ferredoxin